MEYIYTIIIPHHNIPSLLRRCLASIPKRIDLQTIVVDDHSDELYLDDLQSLEKEFPNVAEHYRSLFKEIMVDEFQDSNDVQDELVRLICRKDNVFRVGVIPKRQRDEQTGVA